MMAVDGARLRVFLADDHPIFLAGIAGLVQESGDFEVVGTASNGGLALKLITALSPDIVVMDIAMPERSGIEVLRKLQQEVCGMRSIIVSTYEEQVYIQQALDAGARGYVLKRASADHLMHALRAVVDGGTYIDPLIMAKCLHGQGTTLTSIQVKLPKSPLSERETEILRLVALGHIIKEIAARIGISGKSVETYKMRALEKLGLHSRAQIVEYAIVRGWLASVPERGAN